MNESGTWRLIYPRNGIQGKSQIALGCHSEEAPFLQFVETHDSSAES